MLGLVPDPFLFHSTNRFRYQHTCCILKAIGAAEQKGSGLRDYARLYFQSAVSATVVEMAQVEVCTAPYFLFVTAATDRPGINGRLLTDCTKLHAWLRPG